MFLVISFITTKAKPYKQAGRQQHLLVKTARWRAINRLKICHVKDTVRVRSLSQSEPACSSNASCRRIHISSLQGYNKISLKKQQKKNTIYKNKKQENIQSRQKNYTRATKNFSKMIKEYQNTKSWFFFTFLKSGGKNKINEKQLGNRRNIYKSNFKKIYIYSYF